MNHSSDRVRVAFLGIRLLLLAISSPLGAQVVARAPTTDTVQAVAKSLVPQGFWFRWAWDMVPPPAGIIAAS